MLSLDVSDVNRICSFKNAFIRMKRVIYSQWRDLKKELAYLEKLKGGHDTSATVYSETQSVIEVIQAKLDLKSQFLAWLYSFVV